MSRSAVVAASDGAGTMTGTILGGDGMCMDAEGAVWTPGLPEGRPGCLRVREGGEVLERIDLDRFCFACMLGGADGRTLFMLVVD